MPTYAVRTKRDTAANLVAANRVYGDGTIVVERGADGVSRLKCGNGTSAYNILPYIADPTAIGPADGIASVKQFGAVGNSTGTASTGTNDTIAFQNAINSCCANGKALFIPPGVYRLTARLDIPDRIMIFGVGAEPYKGLTVVQRGSGSWLYFDHVDVGIKVEWSVSPNTISGSIIRDIGTIRNQLTPGPGWTPINSDFDFLIQTADCTIDGLMLWGVCRGINITQPGNGLGRIILANIRGQCFNNGIVITANYDLPRIDNVHFWPFWSTSDDVKAYSMANYIGILVYRSDGLYLSNYFAIWTFSGVTLGQNSFGKMLRGQFTNVMVDLSFACFLVDEAVNGASFQASNIMCATEVGFPSAVPVRIRGSNCRFDICNMELCFAPNYSMLIEGTGNIVNVQQLRISGWNWSQSSFPSLNIGTGNTLRLGNEPIFEDGRGGPIRAGAGTITKPSIVSV